VPASRTSRFAGFDGLRALAALSVFVFHMAYRDLRPLHHWYGRYLTLLDVGVPLFFVISGFLLYRPFVVARFDGAPRPSTREFWRRRILRIVPGFWVALTVVCIVFRVGAQPDRSWKWAIVNYGMLQNYVDTAARPGLPLAWTIGTEMTFYLVLPGYALLLALGKAGPSRQLRKELAGIATLVVLAIAWRALFLYWTLPHPLHWYQGQVTSYLPAHADYFAGGMLLAVLSAWYARSREPRFASWRWMPAGCWLVALAAYTATVRGLTDSYTFGADTHFDKMARHELWLVMVVALAVPAVFGRENGGVIRHLLGSRPLQLVGLISFGIYLYHQAVITWVYNVTGAERGFLTMTFPHGPDYPFPVLVVICLALTMAVATASYLIVEAPFLRRKARPPRERGTVSRAGATVPPSAPR
jgi:peptidoglycan/LPS O-acetylase OafA/YrhL